MNSRSRGCSFAIICFCALCMMGLGLVFVLAPHGIGPMAGRIATNNPRSNPALIGRLQILMGFLVIGMGFLKFILGVGLQSSRARPSASQQLTGPQKWQLFLITIPLVLIAAYIGHRALNPPPAKLTALETQAPLIESAAGVWRQVEAYARSQPKHKIPPFDSQNPPTWWADDAPANLKMIPGVRYQIAAAVVGTRLENLKRRTPVLTLDGPAVQQAFGRQWSLKY